MIPEKDMKEKEYKEEVEVEITKIDIIQDQTKEIDQDKNNFKEGDKEKDKDHHTEKEIIVLDKIGEKMEDIKIKDMKEDINNTLEKDLTLILHQEDLRKKGDLETMIKILTTENIKNMKILKVEDLKMIK